MCGGKLYAQKKGTAKKVTPPPKETPKPDTVIFVDDNPKPQATPNTDALMRSTQRVIVIDKATGKPKMPDSTPPRAVIPVDTVIVIKMPKKKEEEKEPVKVVKVSEYCECMQVNIKASDTLWPDDYINYQFLFKNKCKKEVWVSSSAFGFLVFLKNGTPARQLRKLDFVKQYNYPDFVQIRPGEEFTFMFGDDAFYQYDLHRGWEYKFTFTYYNNMKCRQAPAQTYMCSQFRDKMVFIK